MEAANIIDIVIVNYKSTDLLIECLLSVFESLDGIKAKIFIEDNKSDNSIDQIKCKFEDVQLCCNDQNLGFAAAANKAIKKGCSPYIILLNPDTIVHQGFFSKVVKFLNQNQNTGIVGPCILDPCGTVQGSARSFPNGLTGIFGRNTILTRVFPNNRISQNNILTLKSDGKTPMEVDWVSGACMAIRRKALEEVGVLDERFFMYWEDTDWCKRMWQIGWKVVYLPTTSVTHQVGGSSSKASFNSVVAFHHSAYKLFAKYYNRKCKNVLLMIWIFMRLRLLRYSIFH